METNQQRAKWKGIIILFTCVHVMESHLNLAFLPWAHLFCNYDLWRQTSVPKLIDIYDCLVILYFFMSAWKIKKSETKNNRCWAFELLKVFAMNKVQCYEVEWPSTVFCLLTLFWCCAIVHFLVTWFGPVKQKKVPL